MKLLKRKAFRILLFEGLGTFIVAYGVGCASIDIDKEDPTNSPSPFLIACSLLGALALTGQITDCHFNPSVSIGAHFAKKTKNMKLNIVAQIIGGIIGVLVYYGCTGNYFIPAPDCEHGIDSPQEIAKYCANELVGSFFFVICLLTLTNKFISSAQKSWQMYLSLPIALFLTRLMTGQTILNPAISVPYQVLSYFLDDKSNILYILIMTIPSLIGGTIGGLVMRHLFEPILLYTKFKEQILQQEKSE